MCKKMKMQHIIQKGCALRRSDEKICIAISLFTLIAKICLIRWAWYPKRAQITYKPAFLSSYNPTRSSDGEPRSPQSPPCTIGAAPFGAFGSVTTAFLSNFARPGATSKNNDFRHRPKSIQEGDKMSPGRPWIDLAPFLIQRNPPGYRAC